jgi:hypothetical protein
MPAHKLRPQKLQCPFCPVIATRGTGLSAHVRAKHPRQYGKWNKNPNRLLDADKAASPQLEVRNMRPVLADVHRTAPQADKAGIDVLTYDLSAFKKHGGKLLLYHGLADSTIPPGHTILYYNAVLARMGICACYSLSMFTA